MKQELHYPNPKSWNIDIDRVEQLHELPMIIIPCWLNTREED